ncbi:unnamed protein product, partial [Mesorhabditis spiculigera]
MEYYMDRGLLQMPSSSLQLLLSTCAQRHRQLYAAAPTTAAELQHFRLDTNSRMQGFNTQALKHDSTRHEAPSGLFNQTSPFQTFKLQDNDCGWTARLLRDEPLLDEADTPARLHELPTKRLHAILKFMDHYLGRREPFGRQVHHFRQDHAAALTRSANFDFDFKKAIARRANLRPYRDKPASAPSQRRDVIQEGSWVVKDTSTIRVSLDGGSQDRSLDSLHRLELSVSAGGRASHQLETGMYFAPTNRGSNIDGLRQMPLNEIDDISYDRLGWYRRDADPKFRAYNGLVRFQRVHAVQTTDCKNQKFNSFLDAAHYAGRVDANITPNFTLPRTLEQIHPWIRKAYFYDWKKPGSSSRTVVVSHTEGTNLKIWLKAVGNKENPIRFYQNSSAVADFTGTIVVDAKSNRYFNVTFIEASGKINGEVKDGQDVDDLYVMGFTTYINELNPVNKTLTIPLPAIVGPGTRMICVRPDESPEEKRICHLVTYHETPIEMNMERNSWLDFSGDCPSCNQVKLSNMLKRLNPLSLFDGVKDLGDTVMMLSSVLIYILGLLLAYQVITRVIIPCFECCVCISKAVTECLSCCLGFLCHSPGEVVEKESIKKEKPETVELLKPGWCFRALPTRDAKDVKRQETHYHIESLTVTDPKQLPSMLACACAECTHKPKHAKSPPPRYGSPENGIDI